MSGDASPNQPLWPADRDLWAGDAALFDAVARTGADRAALQAFGVEAGRAPWAEAARGAGRQAPELVRFDRGGRRVDRVEFHPGYHALMALGLGAGYAAGPWEPDAPAGAHATHAAMVYLFTQVEPAVCCPMTMTYAAVPALAADASLAAAWRPKLAARAYDRRALPVAAKDAATMGMAMTERQGGSDLRATRTTARPGDGGLILEGHKWFCSAPMSDGFLTLAQTEAGLACALVPRILPDGTLNAVHLMRLKDKLGNRANASAEIEYRGAWARPLGPAGQGIRTIIEMVHHTRLDTAMAPAGLMRAALAEALWWVRGRSAFGARLVDQPLMRAVLADLALDWEAATALGMAVAAAFDGPDTRGFARIGVALAKFLANKRAPLVVGEAMEALGGMGYVEDTGLPALWREAPLNGIWEGSGNVICLDILRTLGREPEAAAALDARLDAARGTDRRYDAALAAHRGRWPGTVPEAEARWFAERAATLLSAAVLLQSAPPAVADGYVATRVAGERGALAGSVTGLDTGAILARIGGAG